MIQQLGEDDVVYSAWQMLHLFTR